MSQHLDTAVAAARAAGALLRENFGPSRRVNEFAAHDIKLALDVEAQDLITRLILERDPTHAIFGEEGIAGNQASEFQWIVDPLDGTVNYFYGIPHFCVSIALRQKEEILAGVIYDPMREELFTAARGEDAQLNGTAIHVSARHELSEAILSVGLAKVAETIDTNLPVLEQLIHRVRKCRMMGSAALDLAYVACGRLDAYIEAGISLWDVAAGILLVDNAGGQVQLTPRPEKPGKYAIVASSGRISEIAESAKRIAQ
jgi:myo-inositol-1(or 4)-monophosphatase